MAWLRFRATKDRTSFNVQTISAEEDGIVLKVSEGKAWWLLNSYPGNWERVNGRSGKAILPAGQRYVDVEHNLRRIPGSIPLTPTKNMGSVWATNITPNSFRINTSAMRDEKVAIKWEVRE